MQPPHPGIIDLEEIKKAQEEKRAAALSAQQNKTSTQTLPPRPSGNPFGPIRTLKQDLERASGRAPSIAVPAKNVSGSPILSEPREITGLEEFAPVRPSINPYVGENREVIEQAVYRTAEPVEFAKVPPQPAVIIPEKKPTISPLVRPIHTYKEDIASSVKGGASIVSIAAAENTRKTAGFEEGSGTETTRNVVIIAISTLLFIIGAGGSWYAYSVYQAKNRVVVEQQQRDPAQAEKTTELIAKTGSAAFSSQLYSSIQNSTTALNSVERLVPVQADTVTTADGSLRRTPLTTEQFFQRLGATVPDTLIRSLEPSFYLGLNTMRGNQPFLILKTGSFEVALSGMFRWEQTLIRDLQGIFLRPADRVTPPLYGIGTSSTPYRFEDAILQNREIRAVRDLQGNVVLLYTFLDTKTIFITSDEAVLKDVSARLIKAGFVR